MKAMEQGARLLDQGEADFRRETSQNTMDSMLSVASALS
jgi:hypothetical protein